MLCVREDHQSVLREEAQTNEVHLEAEMSFINEDLEILSPKSRRSQSVINLIAVDKECHTDAYIQLCKHGRHLVDW